MDDDINDVNLVAVFNSCQNNFELFFTKIANYLNRTTDFFNSDYQTVLAKTFANVANSRCADEQQQQEHNAHDSLAGTTNGKTNWPALRTAKDLHQLNDDTSRDIFDTEVGTEDLFVPETQDPPDQSNDSNDSGETVIIPLYGKENDSVAKCGTESEDQSEFLQIHPEPNCDELIEFQSQAIFTNLDRNLMRELEISVASKERNAENIFAVREFESNANNANTQMDDASDKQSVDRSGSTTPDLDFISSAQKENTTETGGNDCDDDETQMLSENVFDARTQQMSRAESPNTTCPDNTFGGVSQRMPIFKVPAAASSTPRVLQNSKTHLADDDDIFSAATQRVPEDDVFEAATQALVMENSVSAKRLVCANHNDMTKDQNGLQKSTEHNTSDDLFEMETQIFEAPNPVQPNQDLNDTDIFNAVTQLIEEPDVDVVARKRFPAVMSQRSQPANTPEWSIAARVSNEDIEHFQHVRAEREEARKKMKLKKHRFLFATSSDEEDEEDDDDDDDLEFDLPKPVERIVSASAVKTGERNNLKRRSPKDDADESPSKMLKHNVKPANMSSRQALVRLSRMSTEEITRHIGSKKSPREPTIVAKHSKIESIPEVPEQRNLRRRKSESHEKDAAGRQSKRKMEADKLDAEKMAYVNGGRSKVQDAAPATRNARKKGSKENKASSVTELITEKVSPNYSALVTSVKRRHSERFAAAQKQLRLAILFTKVKSAPYATRIQDLGGCIVDTPQLGNVLICDEISRTFKFLYALTKGIPIVSSKWLDVSAKSGKFEPTESHLVFDKTAEKRFQFSLKKSLESAQKSKLFAGYHIFATQHVQPTRDEISEIVECAGGRYFASCPSDEPTKAKLNTKIVLISHKMDSKQWNKFRKAYPDIQIVSSEGFMQSVMQQKINFSQYTIT